MPAVVDGMFSADTSVLYGGMPGRCSTRDVQHCNAGGDYFICAGNGSSQIPDGAGSHTGNHQAV